MPSATASSTEPLAGYVSRLATGAAVFASAVALLGALVLVGWWLDIAALKSVLPQWVTMKPNTAAGFLLAGTALWLQRKEPVADRTRRASRLCAALIALLGLLTLMEVLGDWDFGIDNALFPESTVALQTAHPGQMSLATAFNFLFAGLALLFLDMETRRGWRPAQWLMLPPLAVSFLAIAGYVYGAEALYRVGPYSSIALHTALAFSLLGLGLFWARPTRGIMALVTNKSAGGMLIRDQLPVILIAIPLLFWLRLLGERAGYYGTEFGIALMVLANIVLLGGTFWWSAHAINRREAARQRAETDLSASERRFAATFEQAAVGIAHVAPNGSWLRVNRKLCAIVGYAEDELLSKTFQDITHPDDLDADLTLVHRMLAREIDNYSTNKRYFRKDGSIVWINLTVALVWTSDGTPDYFISVVEDISARKAAEDELRKLSQAVEQSPEHVMITDRDFNVVYVNDAFVLNTGYCRDEMIGRNPRMLQSGKTPPEVFTAMKEALTHGQPFKCEMTNRRKDGSEYVEFANIAPLRQPDGTISHFVAVKEDITEKKRIGIELDRHRQYLEVMVAERTEALEIARADAEIAQAEAETARRIAEYATQAKSSFLANMSHEIRTPLNAVLGLARIGMRENAGRKTGETCQQILKSGQHLLGVINDILDFSKVESGKLKVEQVPFQPAAVIANACSFVSGAAGDKGLEFRVETVETLPEWALGDPLRLQQILTNLFSNAVKFTASGTVHLAVSHDGDAASFAVIDEGIGMTAEQVGRLFQPFEQADGSTTRQFGGTGLGLAISQRLAGLMGGVISVDSIPGEGSTFTLRLPLPATAAPATPASDEKSALAVRRLDGVRILAADDVDINRLILADILDQAGARHVLVENGLLAVEQVAHAASAFDVVLMDVQMPVMDGYEATRRIREIAPGLPVIGLTAHAFAEERARCEEAGMMEHVTKPIEPDDLIAAIARHVMMPPGLPATPFVAVPPAPTFPEVQGELALIDWARFKQRFKGKPDFLRKLSQSVLADHAGTPEKLRALSEARDFSGIAFLAHNLISVAGNVAASELCDFARDVQKAAHATDQTALIDALRLADRVAAMLEALDAHLNETGGTSP